MTPVAPVAAAALVGRDEARDPGWLPLRYFNVGPGLAAYLALLRLGVAVPRTVARRVV